MSHTRTPWRVSHDTDNCDGADEFPATIWSDTHQHVATVTRADDALFIVKAVNSHADLLAALKAIRTQLGEMNGLCWEESKLRLIVFTDAAIAKAEKESK